MMMMLKRAAGAAFSQRAAAGRALAGARLARRSRAIQR
jgi:hypothetical protein